MQQYPTEIDTAAAGHPAGVRRKRSGRPARMAALALAAALGLHTPAARAADVSAVITPITDFFCQLDPILSEDAFKLPEIGGSYSFRPSGSYVQGRTMGTARITGTIYGYSDTFAIDIMLEGRLDPGDPGHAEAVAGATLDVGKNCVPTGASEWHFYTSLRGTLRDIGADGFNGAVYNLSLEEGFAQAGFGANTHEKYLGVFAKIIYELADPAAYPNLPAGPFAGEMSLHTVSLAYVDIKIAAAPSGEPLDLKDFISQSYFPKPTPDLIGTWEGTTDCAGMTDRAATQSFSGPLLLKVGTQWGWNYPVELTQTVEGVEVLAASYCAQYSDDFGSPGNGTGQMIGADGDPSEVFLKVNQQPGVAATLKARGLIYTPDGPDADQEPDGLSICKWSFTRIDTATPQVATLCSSGMVITP